MARMIEPALITRARRRVKAALALLLTGFGATIAAAIITPSWPGTLAMITYLIGAVAAWYTFGAFVNYGQIQAASRVDVEGLNRIAAALRANADATPADDAERP